MEGYKSSNETKTQPEVNLHSEIQDPNWSINMAPRNLSVGPGGR